jgi:hypothetical protein
MRGSTSTIEGRGRQRQMRPGAPQTEGRPGMVFGRGTSLAGSSRQDREEAVSDTGTVLVEFMTRLMLMTPPRPLRWQAATMPEPDAKLPTVGEDRRPGRAGFQPAGTPDFRVRCNPRGP